MTTTTKTTAIDNPTELNEGYRFIESSIPEMTHALDPAGWIIKSTSQKANEGSLHITLYNENGDPQATAIISPAENSQFQNLTHIKKSALENAIALNSAWVNPEASVAVVLPAILYLALRRGRISGRENIVALIPIPNPQAPLATLMHLDPLPKISVVLSNNTQYLAVAQRIKYSLHYLYQQCSGEPLQLIKNFFVPEILETIEQWMKNFYQGAWTSAIANGTLTKEQYISTLYNTYEYVRLTTRILGRCVAFSDDSELRNHFIYHLKGEINHELFIEHDLKHLGADLDYLKNYHVPQPATKQFLISQESAIGYYQDPLMLLACPLVAEGASANLSPEFLQQLCNVIESWGIKNPEKAATFFKSHARTDGGEDGHWQSVVKTLRKFIKDEHTLQRFLIVMQVAMQGFARSYDENIHNLALWAEDPKQ